MSFSKNKNKTPNKPFRPLYWIAVVCCKAYMKLKYRLKTDNSATQNLKEQIVVIGNHESNLDFIIMASAMYPYTLNFMVSSYFFRHKWLNKLITFMGCIPKTQFVPDTASIRACLSVAKNGGSIGIFPEGQGCFTGSTSEVDKSIAKLIKKLGLTVVVCKTYGNFMTCPKWASGKTYRGEIHSKTEIVCTAKEIKEMDIDLLYDKLYHAIEYNEFDWQRKNRIPFTPKHTTDDLQSILYRCPACNSDFTILSKNEHLFCEKCGYSVTHDIYGFLQSDSGKPAIYDNMSDWYQYEMNAVLNEMERLGESYSMECPCTLQKTVDGKFGYTVCGKGTMTSDWNGMRYTGTKDGEPFTFSAVVEHQSNVTHNAPRHGIDVNNGAVNLLLQPDDMRYMAKFILAYIIARRRYEQQK